MADTGNIVDVVRATCSQSLAKSSRNAPKNHGLMSEAGCKCSGLQQVVVLHPLLLAVPSNGKGEVVKTSIQLSTQYRNVSIAGNRGQWALGSHIADEVAELECISQQKLYGISPGGIRVRMLDIFSQKCIENSHRVDRQPRQREVKVKDLRAPSQVRTPTALNPLNPRPYQAQNLPKAAVSWSTRAFCSSQAFGADIFQQGILD